MSQCTCVLDTNVGRYKCSCHPDAYGWHTLQACEQHLYFHHGIQPPDRGGDNGVVPPSGYSITDNRCAYYAGAIPQQTFWKRTDTGQTFSDEWACLTSLGYEPPTPPPDNNGGNGNGGCLISAMTSNKQVLDYLRKLRDKYFPELLTKAYYRFSQLMLRG